MDSVSQMVDLRAQMSTLKQQLDDSTKEVQKAREGQRAAEQQVRSLHILNTLLRYSICSRLATLSDVRCTADLCTGMHCHKVSVDSRWSVFCVCTALWQVSALKQLASQAEERAAEADRRAAVAAASARDAAANIATNVTINGSGPVPDEDDPAHLEAIRSAKAAELAGAAAPAAPRAATKRTRASSRQAKENSPPAVAGAPAPKPRGRPRSRVSSKSPVVNPPEAPKAPSDGANPEY